MIVSSAKLKRLRESNRLSQVELADLLGVSQSTIWEWEKQDKKVKLEYVLHLCKVLNVQIEDILKDGEVLPDGMITNTKVDKIGQETIPFVNASTGLQQSIIEHFVKYIQVLEEEINRLKSPPLTMNDLW